MFESRKQLPTKKHVNKAKILYVQGDIVSALLIKLVIGLNNDECNC